MPVIAGFALALSAVLTNGPLQQPAAAATTTMPAAQTVEQYVKSYFADEPVMIDIARCESRFTQLGSDGTVVKNPHSSAVGVFQIMSSIHAGSAQDSLGLNIYTLPGNAAYARYLYETQGTAPWSASEACWDKSGTLARANTN